MIKADSDMGGSMAPITMTITTTTTATTQTPISNP
jgi:hypothetical protein